MPIKRQVIDHPWVITPYINGKAGSQLGAYSTGYAYAIGTSTDRYVTLDQQIFWLGQTRRWVVNPKLKSSFRRTWLNYEEMGLTWTGTPPSPSPDPNGPFGANDVDPGFRLDPSGYHAVGWYSVTNKQTPTSGSATTYTAYFQIAVYGDGWLETWYYPTGFLRPYLGSSMTSNWDIQWFGSTAPGSLPTNIVTYTIVRN